ncbi:MAG: ABC transporter substrate-binding protein [bacterium]
MGERIISLAPSVTKILFDLGLEENVVAVTRWCKNLVDIGSRKQLGDCWNADAEEISRLKPDIVIGCIPYGEGVIESIVRKGLRFLALYPHTLSDVKMDILLLGAMLGRKERAENIVSSMDEEIRKIQEKAKKLPGKPRVYCEEWPKPIIPASRWVREMVEIAGGIPIPVQRDEKMAISEETIIRENPEVIILHWCGAGEKSRPRTVYSRPRWQNVDAVKAKRVFAIPDYFLNSPGPNLIEGLKILASLIQKNAQ